MTTVISSISTMKHTRALLDNLLIQDFINVLNFRVATNLENSGNLKNCQNLRENSEKFERL